MLRRLPAYPRDRHVGETDDTSKYVAAAALRPIKPASNRVEQRAERSGAGRRRWPMAGFAVVADGTFVLANTVEQRHRRVGHAVRRDEHLKQNKA